ncbi:hypothetical protein N9X35_04780 [Amylibacter sp.]|nr:hypothetical protein [Amylibacter sp.]
MAYVFNKIKLVHNEANKTPLIFLTLIYALLSYSPSGSGVFWWLQKEDGVLENISFALLLLTSLTFAQIAISGKLRIKRNRSVPFLISFVFFFWAGEEISWGQRVLDYSIDLVAANNTQNEVTLHNQRIIQNYLQYAYFLFFSILSLLSSVGAKSNNKPSMMPSSHLFYFFFLPAVYYGLGSFLYNFPEAFHAPFDNQEIYEFLFAVGIFIYAFEIRSRHKVGISE